MVWLVLFLVVVVMAHTVVVDRHITAQNREIARLRTMLRTLRGGDGPATE